MLRASAVAAPMLTLLAIALLGLAGSFTAPSPIPIGLYLSALGLAIWARRSFPADTFRAGPRPGGTVVIRSGPYRYIRHPMYSAAMLLVWTATFVHLTWWSAALATLVTVAISGRIRWEERLLGTAFSDYADYAKSTRAVIPYLI